MQDTHTDPLNSLVAVVALLAANAFFVGAEFALVKARGVRVQALADEGRRLAQLTLRIQRNLETYLAACQLGITMASLGLGWVGEPAVAALLEPLFEAAGLSEWALHGASFASGFLVFSSLHIVVGEQVPKTLAIRQPEPVSLAVALPLHWFYVLTFPLTWLLNKASAGILTLLRVAEAPHADVLTGDEIRGLIDVSTEHGHLAEDRAVMLHNLFQFDGRPVERIMVPRREVDHLDLRHPGEANTRAILETSHSRLPLVDGDWEHLLGVVLVKEVLCAMVDGRDPLADLAAFAHEPLVVPESQRVPRLLESMRADRAHMAFVLDEYGEFVGLVTLEDLVEEIVGEIADELDKEESAFGIRPLPGGGWTCHGFAPLGDVERTTGFRPAPVDANTLSGLFMQRLERMPAAGDEWQENGYRLCVTEMRQRHVHLCELIAIGNEAPAAEVRADVSAPIDGPAETPAIVPDPAANVRRT